MNEVITVQFALHMGFLNIELFKGDPPSVRYLYQNESDVYYCGFNTFQSEWAKAAAPESYFTKMNLEDLSVEGHMLLNTAMDVNVKLSKVNLIDTQINSSNRINE